MRKLLSRLLTMLALLPGGAMAETAFAPGQVWSLSGPYPQARVVIGKLETFGGKPIVHVTVLDAPLPRTSQELPKENTIAHMPYFEDALRRSVDRLLEDGQPFDKDFEGGYQQWKADNGGVFTITVAEGIDVVREVIIRNNATTGTMH